MKFLGIITFLILLLSACTLPSIEDVPLTGEYYVPLINSEVRVDNLLLENEGFNVTAFSDGRLALQYSAKLASEGINDVLPSISSIGEIPIPDSVSSFSLSATGNFIITKALFSGDEMRFRYSHDKNELIKIKMRIPELTKDGAIFEFDYELNADGDLPYTEFTQIFPLEGFEFNSEENQLTFKYDARNPDGERIKLAFAAMSFNELRFSYGEGSYVRTSFPVEGDSLSLDVLKGWQSGTVEFEKPEIRFDISHTYGFPIAVKINQVQVENTGNLTELLESTVLNEEIDLAFPSFDEVGEVARTSILFDAENSNINTIFSEKVKYVDYNIEAIINPEGSLETKGYATDQSFFQIDAEVNLPLTFKLDELVLVDTVQIDKLFPDQLSSAEFKVVSRNSYPIDMEVFFVFLDENNSELERLLENEPLLIEPTQEKTRFINLESETIERIRSTKKIVLVPRFNTIGMESDFVDLLSDQSLELRIGLKFKL